MTTINNAVDADIVKRMVDFDELPAGWRAVARDFRESELVEVIQSGVRDPAVARLRLEKMARERKLWEVGDG